MKIYDMLLANAMMGEGGGGGGGGNSDFDYMHKVDVYSLDASTGTVTLNITYSEIVASTDVYYFELTEEQVAQLSSGTKPHANTPVACLRAQYVEDYSEYEAVFTELRKGTSNAMEYWAEIATVANDKVTIIFS